ncbi:hypothetical protein [Pseudochryseolinea flava]|uniref:Uncharacterized protein n=1 Tax=Pseudochryseolinea flava TaxID=2059302 RepID=A0A364XVT0_9BACT|nr:hypothetical protein [Pseudochryseolinea flava]RAV98226.1 hypothetical protein DQQ10_24810 [Pseudochryseolinea flava]
MGLAEKRLAESIKSEKLPAFESKLNQIAGYPIKLDIDWNTFTAYDQYPLSRLDIVFDDLESFVKKICKDDMGKEALKDKMEVIALVNTDSRDAVTMALNNKTLTLTMQLAGNTFTSQPDSQIADYVEKLL